MSTKVAHWPYCPDCKQPFHFDPGEPFAYCQCGTTEWGHNGRPHDWVPDPALFMPGMGMLPVKLMVGNTYWTVEGKKVTLVGVVNKDTDHETMYDEHGVHRYSNRRIDMGRCTGSPMDNPKNIPKMYEVPVLNATLTKMAEDMANAVIAEAGESRKSIGEQTFAMVQGVQLAALKLALYVIPK